MNVLCDRHHAGLFYSLQLLGDRLGWTIYTPVGREWWDEGIWRFGEGYGDERLVDQYLSTDDAAWSGWRSPLAGRSLPELDEFFASLGVWRTYDRDYPERPILGIELREARRLEWDYVVATVPDNQRGFARFAAEEGARFVLQVGNTGQQVDWSLDPLVIASSEVPLAHGVRYHQEMHPAYHWRPPEPGAERRIASFVQYMPRTECWPALYAAAQALPEFDVAIHGAGCPDGLVNPTTAVADAMAAAGWGWHDKVTGDGFGHVIWGWAAIGRPLIGHARHYRGQLGEVLWTPDTAIDLDEHPDIAATLRAITPERYREMCEAMRETFAAHYDPERDAQAIREYLT